MEIIITEHQLKLLKESVGVPEGILDAGEKLYNIILDKLKSIDNKKQEYNFDIKKKLKLSDLTINKIKLNIQVNELKDYEGDIETAGMSTGNEIYFDDDILLQVSKKTKELDLSIILVASENWKPEDLYKQFKLNEENNIAILSHELMHKFNRTKQKYDLVGKTADYQAYSSGRINFLIPVIDKFLFNSYFIQSSENIVRPTEIAARMKKRKITKKDFYEFLINDETFKTIKNIRDFSFNDFVAELHKEMDKIENFFDELNIDYSEMTEEDKIEEILFVLYVNLVNLKADIFNHFFYSKKQKKAMDFLNKFGELAFMIVGKDLPNREKQKIRMKFQNHIMKYKDNESQFFKDEFERFNYVSTRLLKKLSKIYSLLPDENTNESIVNWDLHRKIMEKKHGKRPIDTSYNFKTTY